MKSPVRALAMLVSLFLFSLPVLASTAKPLLYCDEGVSEGRSTLIVTVDSIVETGYIYLSVSLYRDDTRSIETMIPATHVYRLIDDFGNRAFVSSRARSQALRLLVENKPTSAGFPSTLTMPHNTVIGAYSNQFSLRCYDRNE